MPCVPLSLGRQNKANSHSDADQEIGGAGGVRRGMLYKQSQLPEAGHRGGVRRTKKKGKCSAGKELW